MIRVWGFPNNRRVEPWHLYTSEITNILLLALQLCVTEDPRQDLKFVGAFGDVQFRGTLSARQQGRCGNKHQDQSPTNLANCGQKVKATESTQYNFTF